MTSYSRFSQKKFVIRRRFKPRKWLYSLFDGPDPYRRLTTHLRMAPGFLIIGAMRAGSTSLYRLLTAHPDIHPPLQKEIYYFDQKYYKGEKWYRAHFPVLREVSKGFTAEQTFQLTCEASPYYLQDMYAPQRIFDTYPSIKLLATLRNPVDRAHSNYWQQVRWGFEKRPVVEAFQSELNRISSSDEFSSNPETMTHHETLHFSYLSRGLYINQLERWYKIFPATQILVLNSEKFFSNIEKNISDVFTFLEVSNQRWSPPKVKQYNKAQYPPLEKPLREKLTNFYHPYNQRLFKLLDTEFDWGL